MRRSWPILLAVLVLFPSITFAHSFHQNDGIFFNAKDNLYRQKSPNRPWQLVSLPDGATIKQSVVFDGKFWAVVTIGSTDQLYVQQKLLYFTPVDGIAPAEQVTIRITGGNVLVLSQSGTSAQLNLIGLGGKVTEVTPSLISTPAALARVVESESQLLYLEQNGLDLAIWHANSAWQPVTQFPCAQSQVIETPILAAWCENGDIMTPQTNGMWTPLNIPPVEGVFASKQLIAGWSLAESNTFYVWEAGALSTLILPLGRAEIDQTIVNGRRILFKKIGGNWQELIWLTNLPQLLDLTATNTGLIVTTGSEEQLLINGSSPQISEVAGTWQLINVGSDFDFARKTPLGTLVWNNGSLTQYAPDGSTTFTKVNPWSSTTSPIQAVEIGPTVSFVSVITQSGAGNVNLYKTADFTHWSRITLPTKPTFSLSLADTRNLPVGSLVEVDGVLTVPPGVVGAEIAYLEDLNAGIQIFLSKSIGNLPYRKHANSIVTGEVSSSQAKRIVLDSADDLETGDSVTWVSPNVQSGEAADFLGRSVSLIGNVDHPETDDVYLRQINGLLRLHFTGAKTIFQADDQVSVPAVVDWNSATGKAESWALSTDYQLLSRVTTTVAPAPPAISTAKTTSTSKAPPATTAVKTVSNTTTRPTIEPSNEPVIIGAAQTNGQVDNRQAISMSAISLIAGLLSFRGRRFRRWTTL